MISFPNGVIFANGTIVKELSGSEIRLQQAALGISNGADDLLDTIEKQVLSFNRGTDLEGALKSLGHIEYFLNDIRRCLGVTREQCLVANTCPPPDPGWRKTRKSP